MKSKIAIVDNSIGVTGAFKAIMSYAEYGADQFEFFFFTPKGSRTTDIIKKREFAVYELPFLEISKTPRNLFLYPFILIKNSVKFKKESKRLAIDLVHTNDFYNMVPVVAKILGAKYKIITHVRFMPDRFPKILKSTWITLHVKYSERIVCVSDAVKANLPHHEKIIRIYDRLPEQTLSIIPRNHKPLVKMLYLSHYIYGKGHDLALSAFDLAFKKNENLRLEFVGGDLGLHKNKEYRKGLEKITRNKGLMGVITFSGEIENTSSKMIEADIFLNFSESESFSMTTLEALSLGVPTIASDCGGPAELYQHGQSGILVPNRNVKEMSDAILKLALDSDLRTKFSINGIQYVQRRFSVSNTYEKLKKLYKQVLKNEIK